ncbi:MAG TPA: ABC transporter substrate-binding protein [Candidatus Binatia bacterium]|jgi:ABC-type nitrate/sulfonate/bicarbonate transport system substrate-binding protein|nr:ABC transporter substrate-binding protein [Candidatus Binatia bacterium]
MQFIARAGLLLALLLAAAPSFAATPLTRVVMTTGSFAEREGVVYVAQDQGFFKKYGIDLSFVQVRSGPVGMAALASGESQFHWGSVTAANLGAIAEGADIVFIAGFINKLTGAFVVNSKIKTPQEIKGKTLGVNSLSGGGWMFTMLALDHWGLDLKRDNIQIRALGSDGVRSEALSSGVIDGCQIGYTFASLLQNKGFRVLADLEKLPISYQGSGMMARRAFVTSSPAVVENTLRGLLDAAAFIRNRENKAAVMKSLVRGLRLARVEDAEEGYNSIVDIYEKKIYPSTQGIANVIRLLGQSNAKIRRLKAEDLVETSAVRKLEKEGKL